MLISEEQAQRCGLEYEEVPDEEKVELEGLAGGEIRILGRATQPVTIDLGAAKVIEYPLVIAGMRFGALAGSRTMEKVATIHSDGSWSLTLEITSDEKGAPRARVVGSVQRVRELFGRGDEQPPEKPKKEEMARIADMVRRQHEKVANGAPAPSLAAPDVVPPVPEDLVHDEEEHRARFATAQAEGVALMIETLAEELKMTETQREEFAALAKTELEGSVSVVMPGTLETSEAGGTPMFPPWCNAAPLVIELRSDIDVVEAHGKARLIRVKGEKGAFLERFFRVMVMEGRCKVAHGPTPWVAATFTVNKKTSPLEHRIVVDKRAQNRITLPVISPPVEQIQAQQRAAQAAVIVTADMLKAFYQIQLAEESRAFSVFDANGLPYVSLAAEMGAQQSMAKLQHMMATATKDVPEIFPIADDLTVVIGQHDEDESVNFTPEGAMQPELFAEFKRLMCELFRIIVKWRIMLSAKKWKAGRVVEVLGVQTGLGRVGLLGERVDSLVEMTSMENRPRHGSGMRHMLAAVAQATNFLPGASEAMRPLHKLGNHGDKEFSWEGEEMKEQRAAWDALAKAVRSPCAVYAVDDNDPWVQIITDASQTNLSASVFQLKRREVDGEEKLFMGRITSVHEKTSEAQTGYSPMAMELAAVHMLFRRRAEWLVGRKCLVFLDNKVFESLRKMSTKKRIRRMLFDLAEFEIYVLHVNGKELPLADYISRLKFSDGSGVVAADEGEAKTIGAIGPAARRAASSNKRLATRTETAHAMLRRIEAERREWKVEMEREVDEVANNKRSLPPPSRAVQTAAREVEWRRMEEWARKELAEVKKAASGGRVPVKPVVRAVEAGSMAEVQEQWKQDEIYEEAKAGEEAAVGKQEGTEQVSWPQQLRNEVRFQQMRESKWSKMRERVRAAPKGEVRQEEEWFSMSSDKVLLTATSAGAARRQMSLVLCGVSSFVYRCFCFSFFLGLFVQTWAD